MMMDEHVLMKPKRNHSQQWIALKRLYVSKRGSDAGKNRKAIPRTTNGDVAQLARYWDGEFKRAIGRRPEVAAEGKNKRDKWLADKERIDDLLAGREATARFAENEWFWQRATHHVAVYLQARKSAPTEAELFIDALAERGREVAGALADAAQTAGEKAADVAVGAAEAAGDAAEAVGGAAKSAGKAVLGIGSGVVSTLKTGALIAAGVVGAAIVLPPVIRSFRDE
jgi:hypothetical protein